MEFVPTSFMIKMTDEFQQFANDALNEFRKKCNSNFHKRNPHRSFFVFCGSSVVIRDAFKIYRTSKIELFAKDLTAFKICSLSLFKGLEF